jgi:hypothetical protein
MHVKIGTFFNVRKREKMGIKTSIKKQKRSYAPVFRLIYDGEISLLDFILDKSHHIHKRQHRVCENPSIALLPHPHLMYVMIPL